MAYLTNILAMSRDPNVNSYNSVFDSEDDLTTLFEAFDKGVEELCLLDLGANAFCSSIPCVSSSNLTFVMP